MSDVLDAVVVGAGPAGLTAARVIAEGGARCTVIDRMGPGGLLMYMGPLHDVEAPLSGKTGPELIEDLAAAAIGAGAELLIDDVMDVKQAGGDWLLKILDQQARARTLVIATGLDAGRLGIDNEAEYEGHGISHCANCDGPFYAGKPVVVAGGDRWALQEALDLTASASGVTLVSARPVEESVPEAARFFGEASGVRHVAGRIVGLGGTGRLDHVLVEGSSGRERVPAAGLFVFADRRPQTAFLGKLPVLADGGAVNSRDGTTAIASLFACGDVRMGAMQRIPDAIADGARAGQNVLRWLGRSAQG